MVEGAVDSILMLRDSPSFWIGVSCTSRSMELNLPFSPLFCSHVTYPLSMRLLMVLLILSFPSGGFHINLLWSDAIRQEVIKG